MNRPRILAAFAIAMVASLVGCAADDVADVSEAPEPAPATHTAPEEKKPTPSPEVKLNHALAPRAHTVCGIGTSPTCGD